MFPDSVPDLWDRDSMLPDGRRTENPRNRPYSVPGKLVSFRQHPDTPITKDHESFLEDGRDTQLRIDVAICL
jgi:hypothetical protein